MQSCQVVIRNERETLNVVSSKAPKVASRPAGGMGACGGTGREQNFPTSSGAVII